MNKNYVRDETPGRDSDWNSDRMANVIAVAMVLLVIGSCIWGAANAAERPNVTSGVSYHLVRSGQFIDCLALHVVGRSAVRPCLSDNACEAQRIRQREADAGSKTSGSARYVCRTEQWTNVSYGPNTTPPPPACPASPEPRQQTCPSGYTGSFRQDAVVGTAPACVVTWNPSTPPTGACTPIPMPEPTGAATLTWTHNGATGYRIVYGRTATALTQVIQINSGTQRTFTVNGLPAGTHYFAVKAFSDGNESAPSNVLSKVVAP